MSSGTAFVRRAAFIPSPRPSIPRASEWRPSTSGAWRAWSFRRSRSRISTAGHGKVERYCTPFSPSGTGARLHDRTRGSGRVLVAHFRQTVVASVAADLIADHTAGHATSDGTAHVVRDRSAGSSANPCTDYGVSLPCRHAA